MENGSEKRTQGRDSKGVNEMKNIFDCERDEQMFEISKSSERLV